MFKFLLGKIISREIWHLSDLTVKERRRKKAIQKYFDEEQQRKELEQKENLLKFSSHIEKADRFLQDSVMLEQLVRDKRRDVIAFFEHNGDTKRYNSFFSHNPSKRRTQAPPILKTCRLYNERS